MREIKFRAWLKDDGVGPWLGFMYQWDNEFFSDMSPVTGYGNTFPDQFDDSVVLMQYTGLKDKNGVEIYEGDVMPYEWGDGSVTNGVVVFEEGCFWLGDAAFVDIKPGVYEVIGNIHENADLLKRTEQ